MNILVLCTGNSCRSQMAHGWLNYFSGGTLNIYSAGIEIHALNSKAISVMSEEGIDISRHTSNHVDEYQKIDFNFIITVCNHAAKNCPIIPSKNALRFHFNFSDPSKVQGGEVEIQKAFRKTRKEIKNYCKNIVKKISA